MRNWFNIGNGSDNHFTSTDRRKQIEKDKKWFEAFIDRLLESNREINHLPNRSYIVKGSDCYFSHLTVSNKYRVILRYTPKWRELALILPDDWYQDTNYSVDKPVNGLIQDINDELSLASRLIDIHLNKLASRVKRSLSDTGYGELDKGHQQGEYTGFYTPVGSNQHGVTLTLTSSIYGSYELTVEGSGPSVTAKASRNKLTVSKTSERFIQFIEDQAQADNMNQPATISNKRTGVLDINIPKNIHTVKITQEGGQEVTVTLGDTTEATQTTGLSLDVIASELEDTLAYRTKYRGLGVKAKYVNTEMGNIRGAVFMKNLTEEKFAEENTKRPFILVWNSERKRAFLSVSGDDVEGAFEHEDELNEKTVAGWVKSMLYNYVFFGSFLNDH